MLAEINKFTTEEHKQYQKSLESMSEFDNIINSTAELAEMRGRAEGRAELKLEIAKEMIAEGMPNDKISRFTGLSIEEIEALRA